MNRDEIIKEYKRVLSLKKVVIQIGAGCPSGSTVDWTNYIQVTMIEEVAPDFVSEMMLHIQEQAQIWMKGSE